MSTIEEQADAYESSRERITALARQLDERQLSTNVPCCPAWSVKDVISHLTGALEDRRDERMPKGSFADWTDAQVARHRDEPTAETLDTWNGLEVSRTDAVPSLAAFSFDAVTHEHDLYQALGIAGDRTTDSVRVGAQRALARMSLMLQRASAPGVRVTTVDGTQVAEGGEPPIGLATTRYTLTRLVTGRMSRGQAEALAWNGDATPVLDALYADGFFALQPADVIEVEGF